MASSPESIAAWTGTSMVITANDGSGLSVPALVTFTPGVVIAGVIEASSRMRTSRTSAEGVRWARRHLQAPNAWADDSRPPRLVGVGSHGGWVTADA
jgi:hypothetical protein